MKKNAKSKVIIEKEMKELEANLVKFENKKKWKARTQLFFQNSDSLVAAFKL